MDWGVKSATGNKNVHGLVSADGLLAHYQPAVLVLEDPTAPDVRRVARLCEQLLSQRAFHQLLKLNQAEIAIKRGLLFVLL